MTVSSPGNKYTSIRFRLSKSSLFSYTHNKLRGAKCHSDCHSREAKVQRWYLEALCLSILMLGFGLLAIQPGRTLLSSPNTATAADLQESQSPLGASSPFGQLEDIVEVVGGNAHSCARNSSGEIYCWGNNAYGQLGDGSTKGRQRPVQVINIPSTADALFANGDHTCVLVQVDSMDAPEPNAPTSLSPYCWGRNSNGQLGDGSTQSSNRPVPVVGLPQDSTIISIAMGSAHTCGLMDQGEVYCWGSNEYGQLGNESQEDSSSPVLVTGFGVAEDADANISATLVAAGGFHTCALTESNMLCWGKNEFGQLGDGQIIDSLVPVSVVDVPNNVKSIALGNFHSCAVSQDGRAFCWGSNYYGQLGNGTDGPQNNSAFPTQVAGIGQSLEAIYSSGLHTCGVRESQETFCWGYNNYGQLGDGTTDNRNQPTRVRFSGREFPPTVATGYNHTCSIANNQLLCWGSNYSGQVGDGSTINRDRPTLVIEPLGQTFLSYVAVPVPATATPTPVPAWQQIGLNGLIARSVGIMNQLPNPTLFVGQLRTPQPNSGLHRGTIGNGCLLPVAMEALPIAGSGMDIDFAGNTGVWANFDNRPHYTLDQGQTWTQANSNPNFRPYSVTYDATHGWFAGANEGLFRSVDNGASWSTVSESVKDINVVEASGGEIWIGATDGSVHTYKPEDNTMPNVQQGLPNDDGFIIWDILAVEENGIPISHLLATSRGVYQGTGNLDWVRVGGTELDGTEVRSLALGPTNALVNDSEPTSQLLYAGTTAQGVWKVNLDSVDGWQRVESPGWNPNVTVRDLLYDDQFCQGLFAGTDNGVWLLTTQ